VMVLRMIPGVLAYSPTPWWCHHRHILMGVATVQNVARRIGCIIRIGRRFSSLNDNARIFQSILLGLGSVS
jgi:hypothetical protein